MYLFRLLLAIWTLGLLGTLAELFLLEHFDGALQSIPLVMLALGAVVSAWYASRRNRASLRAFEATLVVFAIGGALGLVLHYRGNVEFEKERAPELHGWSLFWHAITGATPALAPGTMTFLAAIGFAVIIADPRGQPGRAGVH